MLVQGECRVARVVVVGAGLTGLGAALFLARRGHQVDVLEQDEAASPRDSESAFSAWARRGVPHARQSHVFRGLSAKVLSQEAPDLLAELDALAFRCMAAPTVTAPFAYAMAARRLPYEAIFRRAVERQSGVALQRGVRAAGLVAREGGHSPHVVGVRATDGAELGADLVVDASGRWTEASGWLGEIGARPWREELHETPIFYLTRWYRLRGGARLPDVTYPLGVPLPYLLVLAFPGDSGTFSVSVAASMADPCRVRLRHPDAFTEFLGAVPAIAPLLDIGEPVTDPQPLARINNCHRSLMLDDGPCVTGLVLLGDACDHTNPTLGRGVSLGLAHAQQLANTVEQAIETPAAHAAAFDRWTARHIGGWFRSQVENDAAYLAGVEASLTGEPPKPPSPQVRFRRAVQALAADDPEVALAAAREAHLLAPPGSVEADPGVAAKVRAFMQKTEDAAPPLAGPTRKAFEALMAG